MSDQLVLTSFKICPYVQRAVIALKEKQVPYTIQYINPYEDNPDWFKAISPLGKVPVLQVNGRPVFESAIILEYLEEVYAPHLHPSDPLTKASHRAWMEFSSDLLVRQFQMNNAPDAEVFKTAKASFTEGLKRLGEQLDPNGPYFAGADLSLADVACAPLLMRLDFMERHFKIHVETSARMQQWSEALLARTSVKQSVVPEFEDLMLEFLKKRGSFFMKV